TSEIDHRTGVGVPSAELRRSVVPGVWSVGPYPVYMVTVALDVIEHERIEMLPGLTVVVRSLHHMEEVRDHASHHECLAIVIEVDPPGVAATLREHLELVALGVETPDAGVDLGPF